MKFFTYCLIALSLCCLAGSRPQNPSPANEADTPDHFAALTPLIGKVWRGTFPGGELHDTQEFEWMLGGKFVRNVHRVTSLAGKVVYEGETIYGWDHESERVRWWYFNATGGQVIGDLVQVDGRWIAEGRNHGPKGQPGRVRSDLVIGEDSWTSISFLLDEDEWAQQGAMEFSVLRQGEK